MSPEDVSFFIERGESHARRIKVLTGMPTGPLAQKSATIRIPTCDTQVSTFSDGESTSTINEMCAAMMFLVQSTSTPDNNNLMELLPEIDALRGHRGRITRYSYYGYAPAGRKVQPRVPISSKMSPIGLQPTVRTGFDD
jgi:ribose-phosphate pyrophosphokinase